MEEIGSRDLLFRIRQVCQLDDRPLLLRLQELFGDTEPVSGRNEGPLSIPRSRGPLEAASEEQFNAYLEEVRDLRELEAFLEKYRGTDAGPLCKLTEKLAGRITQKFSPVYDPDEDNAEQLAGCVYKHILEYRVGKISEALFRVWNKGGEALEPVARDLTEALNTYLARLGVYTMTARAGEPFSEVEDYYDTLKYQEQLNDALMDEIVSVERPAYVLEYIDMDGARQRVVLMGICLLKVGQ